MKYTLILLTFLAACGTGTPAPGPSPIPITTAVTLAWTAPSPADPAIIGYRVYTAAVSGDYTYGAGKAACDVPSTQTTCQITLETALTYFLVATDYDAAGNESGPSNEIEYPNGVSANGEMRMADVMNFPCEVVITREGKLVRLCPLNLEIK